MGWPVDHGYTEHEMDAEVGLINMRARLYDPVLGRFISADVTIDAPGDMQTYNRYTYVMNNPFAHTDPSGNWSWHNFWKAAKPVVIVAVAVATNNYLLTGSIFGGAGVGILAGNSILAGAISGAVAGAIGGGVQGAIQGAITGAVFAGIGTMDLHGLEHHFIHGLAGAGLSAAFGGDPVTGFVSAFVPASFGDYTQFFPSSGPGDYASIFARTMMAGTIGGLTRKVKSGTVYSFQRLPNG